MEVDVKFGWIVAVHQLAEAIGESGDEDITSDSITDASNIGKQVLTATTQANARSAIGAGTSNLSIGTTASTAKAGNYTPTWGEVTGKPPIIASGNTQADARSAIGAGTSSLAIGTTASTAKAGNYVPTWGEVTGKPSVIASGSTQADARSAIGAGTSSLVIGTTASTAKAGNYVPTTQEVASALSAKTQISGLVELGEDSEIADVIVAINSIISALKA